MNLERLKHVVQILAAVAILATVFWLISRPPAPAEISTRGEVRLPNGTMLAIEIADTPETRERGLSFRRTLPEGRGFLFVFPEKGRPIFWMKDMKFPIDILWLNDGKIMDFITQAPPFGSLPPIQYLPEADANQVLEIPSGAFEAYGLKLGDQLDIRFPEGYTPPTNS